MELENQNLPEVTIKAFILGIVLSAVLAAANAYLGLFAGMTVSASIPAAVVSMAFLKLFKHSNILENNNAQTAASSGEAVAAGAIFTLPALIILGAWQSFDYKWVTIIAVFGGALGVLFTIPLRRSLIVEKKLCYPEGIATAQVLQAGQEGGRGVLCIAKAALAGALFKAGAGAIGLWPQAVEGAKGIAGSLLYFGSNLSPALLSVGYIVGLNIAVLIFIGGACNWLVAIPICARLGDWPVHPQGHELAGQAISALEYAARLWSTKTRYLGVGAMLVGGLWTIFHMRASLLSGITGGLKAYRDMTVDHVEIPRTEKDIPMKWVLVLIVGSIVPLFLLYQVFVRDVYVSLAMAAIMLVAGFIFSAVAGYMAGLVGSSNNPISGVTIATLVVSSLLLLLLMGKDAPNGPSAAIIIGSVICCAAAIAGDNMQDLKTGYILGATPWKQQLVNLAGSVAGALVIAPVMTLLLKAYGFEGQPGAGPNALPAPQANLMASVAKGVFRGDLPWNYVYAGMAVGVCVIALDLYLQRKGSSFRTPVLAVAIGFYLPFELSVPIFAGGLIHHALKLYNERRNASAEEVEGSSRNGLLFASGLITGEALMGIIIAIPIVILAKKNISLPLIKDMPFGSTLGIVLLLAVAYWLYATAKQK
ncbi:MAG TPA: oligopeptide transporter, OPT family [Sedimentisphaerales bacterium]|nr:oligopeptide transporter, OPT family [Sedimentisphaerales bacterium]